MEKIKISAVSFLNTLPFVYGIKHSDIQNKCELSIDVPAVCADKLLNNIVDIALTPVAIIPKLHYHQIISDFCIGAEKKVRTVCLFSNVKLPQIKKIYLDKHSLTSVQLAKVLAKYYWKIKPQWINMNADISTKQINYESIVAIGDKAFELEKQYPFIYDLAEEWQQLTSLPFVFACWITNKKIPDDFLIEFNNAMKLGISHIPDIINDCKKTHPNVIDINSYYKNNISYSFDERKKLGLAEFLKYLKQLTINN